MRREQKKIVEGRKIGIDFLSYENNNVDVEECQETQNDCDRSCLAGTGKSIEQT